MSATAGFLAELFGTTTQAVRERTTTNALALFRA
jgi:hypothetical protein